MTIEYATVHLQIDRSEPMPHRTGMYHMLKKMGLATSTQECFWAIAYDAAMNIRTIIEINRGTYATVGIHLPSLFTAVLVSGSDRFQVAHNHPDGNVLPTGQDIKLTQTVMEGANQLGLYFDDHSIVGPSDGQYLSFVEKKLLIPAKYTGELSA